MTAVKKALAQKSNNLIKVYSGDMVVEALRQPVVLRLHDALPAARDEVPDHEAPAQRRAADKHHARVGGCRQHGLLLRLQDHQALRRHHLAVQRALAAKSLAEAQRGIVLASFLKLVMPIIIG